MEIKIFLSSVFNGLEKERGAVKKAIAELNNTPYSDLLNAVTGEENIFRLLSFDEPRSRTGHPDKECPMAVQTSDIFICIIGGAYGVKTNNGLSPTHNEYREAISEKNGDNRKILVYIKPEKREKETEEFLKEIKGKNTFSEFISVDGLNNQVKSDILTEIVRDLKTTNDQYRRDIKRKISEIIDTTKSRNSQDDEVEKRIYELVGMIRKEIYEFRLTNVNYAVTEFILAAYSTNINIYAVFKDIFESAENAGERPKSEMISAINNLMLENWAKYYNIKLAESCCDLLLLLAIENIEKDFKITKSCYISMDNLAGDMFEKEVFSRIILLGAVLYKKAKEGNKEAEELKGELLHDMKKNESYSHEDGRYDYLFISTRYAKKIQTKYKIDIREFYKNEIGGIIREEIDEQISMFAEDLYESSTERHTKNDVKYDAEYFLKLYYSYKPIEKRVEEKIIEAILEKQDKKTEKYFNRVRDWIIQNRKRKKN